MSEEALKRDEQYQQLLELKDKIKRIDQVILEGEHAEDFKKNHPFWPIFERTFKALRETYNADAHKASKDSRAEISHFLGREEAIKDVFYYLDDFTSRADSAAEEKKIAEEQIKELHSILGSPDGESQDLGGAIG